MLEKKDKTFVKAGVWIASVILGCDQASKYWINTHFSFQEIWPVCPGFNLTLRYNPGAAFSFLAHHSGWQRWFLIGLACLAILLLSRWLAKVSYQDKQEGVGLSLVLGGAFGNLVDRLWHGQVIDFLSLYYGSWEWPAFNLADMAICIGAALLAPIVWKKTD